MLKFEKQIRRQKVKSVGINVKVQIDIFTEYFYKRILNFITRHSLDDPFIEILICQTS